MGMSASSSTITGAFIAIGAAILNAIGYTLQKKGHNKVNSFNRSSTGCKQKKIIQDKTWCIGMFIFIIGGLANALALYFAPQSVVLPLSAVTLVANTYAHILYFIHSIHVHNQSTKYIHKNYQNGPISKDPGGTYFGGAIHEN